MPVSGLMLTLVTLPRPEPVTTSEPDEPCRKPRGSMARATGPRLTPTGRLKAPRGTGSGVATGEPTTTPTRRELSVVSTSGRAGPLAEPTTTPTTGEAMAGTVLPSWAATRTRLPACSVAVDSPAGVVTIRTR